MKSTGINKSLDYAKKTDDDDVKCSDRELVDLTQCFQYY
jgi:hypothetical protein